MGKYALNKMFYSLFLFQGKRKGIFNRNVFEQTATYSDSIKKASSNSKLAFIIK
ncbi:hypothetical protein PROVALCAL_02950 [Providencia alcalifaciens DSM 30120]|uniref:Uncharacterized protein n=1 Tax=Providencia alcalifaciens DSM 30120 TaxID=520999 RepID=B6XHW2_9GAMM|nr:hypothetical protein PROVALCAL_02950 [Providencia alcalifaciens DSM 30120]